MIEALLLSNVLLWVCVVALSLAVLALVRQVGVLHERVAPAGALMTGEGPAVGDPSPVVSTRDLEGRSITIGAARADGMATLLFFLSPTCPVCKTLLPTVLRVGREQPRPLRVVLASDGEVDEHRAFVERQHLALVPYVLSAEVGLAFRVGKLPYAVLIDGDGIVRARGLVNTREHLESLLEAERLGVASVQELIARRRDQGEAA